MNELFQRENRVLHYWTMRKRRLDQCQQYVVFERSAKQVSHPLAPLPALRPPPSDRQLLTPRWVAEETSKQKKL